MIFNCRDCEHYYITEWYEGFMETCELDKDLNTNKYEINEKCPLKLNEKANEYLKEDNQ